MNFQSAICLWLMLMLGDVFSLVEKDQLVQSPLEQVVELVSQVVTEQLVGCHLVLATSGNPSVSPHTFSKLTSTGQSLTVVDVDLLSELEEGFRTRYFNDLWRDHRVTCAGLIVDLFSSNNTNLMTRFMTKAELRLRQQTWVLAVGGRTGVKQYLLHHSLRNTIHALYLALETTSAYQDPQRPSTLAKPSHLKDPKDKDAAAAVTSERVWVYGRCVYCEKGRPGVRLLDLWNISSLGNHDTNVFYSMSQLQDWNGYQLRVTSVAYFPYVNFKRDKDIPGTTLTLLDSVAKRVLHTLSRKRNFTYEVREPKDRGWGNLQPSGNWSGMIGKLVTEKSDVATLIAPTPLRLLVVDYWKGYEPDPMVIITLKPTLLAQHLSIIRPFTGEVWAFVLASTLVMGFTLWLLQWAWSRFCEEGGAFGLSYSLLSSWGILFESPPHKTPLNISGQVVVGLWLIVCVVINSGYRSSLIAHMTVQTKTQPLDTFQELVDRSGWNWGIEKITLTGAPREYFAKTPDPTIQTIYKNAEKPLVTEGLQKVLGGRYGYIDYKLRVGSLISAKYTDTFGNTPYYIGKQELPIFAEYGWGIRKGAAFRTSFSNLVSRLEEAGILALWRQQVIANRAARMRAEEEEEEEANEEGDSSSQRTKAFVQEEDRHIVLSLEHVQGAFYLLFIGCILALLALLGETLTHAHCPHHAPVESYDE